MIRLALLLGLALLGCSLCQAQVQAIPPTLAFPATVIGTSSTLQFTVRNSTNTTQQIAFVSINGLICLPLIICGDFQGWNTDFSVSGCAVPALAPGESCVVSVTFRPTAVGPRLSEAWVEGSFRVLVPLSGTAIPNQVPTLDRWMLALLAMLLLAAGRLTTR